MKRTYKNWENTWRGDKYQLGTDKNENNVMAVFLVTSMLAVFVYLWRL